MKPIIDYHIHTYLCGHASGEPYQYVEKAISEGLKSMGFSDHAPFVSHNDPDVTMSVEQMPLYFDIVHNLKNKYKDKIDILFGVEADFMPGFEAKTKDVLSKYNYDYIFGSVHFIDNWGFDNPTERPKFDKHNINDIYRVYFDLLRKSAQTGMFDIMAHVDLMKKFGDKPTDNLLKDVKKTAECFKDCGVSIEINTSGLRKPVKEIYPSQEFLKVYSQTDVPIVFGSDSHLPSEVAWEFDFAAEYAFQAGYRNYVLYKDREIIKKIDL